MSRLCTYCNRIQPRSVAFRGECCWECYSSAKALPEGLVIFFLRNVRRPDGKYDCMPEQGVIVRVVKNYLPTKRGIFRYRVSNGFDLYWVYSNDLSTDLHLITEKSREINKRRRARRDAEL